MRVTRGLALAGVLLAGCPCAFALNPELDVSQYAHTPWKIRDGFPKGQVYAIAQTPDGYLWLGTEFGLFRYDGARSVPWQPPPDQSLRSSNITRLLAAHDGTLWIGTRKGLASWKSGKLTQYSELDGQVIGALLQDREGSIWSGGLGTPTGRLCAIHEGAVHCYEQDGALGVGVTGLYEDSKRNLWVGGDFKNRVLRWKPGPPQFFAVPGEQGEIRALTEGDDGALLIAVKGGVKRLIDGNVEPAYPFPLPCASSWCHKYSAIAMELCGSQLQVGDWCMYTRGGRMYLPLPMVFQAILFTLSLRITKAISGSPRLAAWTAFATSPPPRFRWTKVCRMRPSCLSWRQGMEAFGSALKTA